MTKRTRVEGAIDAATGVLHDGLRTVEDVHMAIAKKPFVSLRLAPGVAEISEAVRVVHHGITSGIYSTLRTGIDALGVVARSAATVAQVEDREPRAGSAADLLVAAINGVAGDRLAQDDNPLALQMEVRRGQQRVPLQRAALGEAFPDAGTRIALFVHGLSGNESTWGFYSRDHYGQEGITYGSRLADGLGHTPVYVRYNSGLHISKNGSLLALLIEELVREWPQPVEELVLVGHSMGGLVLRSACHQATQTDMQWKQHVRHVFFLGSPHLGAPLEKFGNAAAWVLDRFDVSRAFATLINKRSAGIKDLRFGAILDEHWQGADPDALLDDRTGPVPLLEGANHYFVAATVTRDPAHPLGKAIGDWLVRASSATPRRWRHLQLPLGDGRHFGPMTHMQLLNHPDIYEQMRSWLEHGEPATEDGEAK